MWRKLLEAFDEGKGGLDELAERFGISLGWAWKALDSEEAKRADGGPSYRPGAKHRIDEQALTGLFRSHPGATWIELQTEFENKTGRRVSTRRLRRAVRSLIPEP